MDKSPATNIAVTVVYALPQQCHEVRVVLPDASTVQEAVTASKLLDHFPDLRTQALMLGIFGERVTELQALRDGDRVEIYRPLLIDPKVSRHQRAAMARNRKRH